MKSSNRILEFVGFDDVSSKRARISSVFFTAIYPGPRAVPGT